MITYTLRCALLTGSLVLDPSWHVMSISRLNERLDIPTLPVIVVMTRTVNEGEHFLVPDGCAQTEVSIAFPKAVEEGSRDVEKQIK